MKKIAILEVSTIGLVGVFYENHKKETTHVFYQYSPDSVIPIIMDDRFDESKNFKYVNIDIQENTAFLKAFNEMNEEDCIYLEIFKNNDRVSGAFLEKEKTTEVFYDEEYLGDDYNILFSETSRYDDDKATFVKLNYSDASLFKRAIDEL